ncbi:uncharacterized protein RCC_08862 [Ramularia collo-cygni]|uniref:F-box domain-containing protein n=1 Tax=Ramularia collo-cygni TaxID=112498 RepID=A0A2D3VDL6_9PEZI|nr:uncharacterized protein RCC_08862 [Ramularia collo-cygni]CZT23152.1 uncharacterized protein RCC_08862 [Ramularia collo-cygni]
MATSDPPAAQGDHAAKRVLGTQELLEQILKNLGPRDLTRAMRICKHFDLTINTAPGFPRLLLRQHLPAEVRPWTEWAPPPRLPLGLNLHLNGKEPYGLLGPRNCEWYITSAFPLRLITQNPFSGITNWDWDLRLNKRQWNASRPLIGENHVFKIFSIYGEATWDPKYDEIILNLEMKKIDSWNARGWRQDGGSSLEKTLLSKFKMEGTWSITVKDRKWRFEIIKQTIFLDELQVTTRRKSDRGHVCIIRDTLPINGTVGEILMWLEELMEVEIENIESQPLVEKWKDRTGRYTFQYVKDALLRRFRR